MNTITPSNPAKITLHNIKRFIQGWVRYFILKNSKNPLVKKFANDLKVLQPHQVEQYNWRLTVMNPECLSSGHCVICGCETPQLQMCGDACEGNCYPAMMSKEEWEAFKLKNQIVL